MTLKPYDPKKLDEFTLKLLDLALISRAMAEKCREHNVTDFAVHDRKAMERYGSLKEWLDEGRRKLERRIANPSYAVTGLDRPWNKDLRSFSGQSFHYIGTTSSIRWRRRGRVTPRRWRRAFWASSGSVTQRSRTVPLWWPCLV